MLLLSSFKGPSAYVNQAQIVLGAAWTALVAIGTLASPTVWSSLAAMVAVGFTVLFLGVISSALAGVTPALLMGFILAVAAPAPASALPERVAGAGIATLVALLTSYLWPITHRDPLRDSAASFCDGVAAFLRTEFARETAADEERDRPRARLRLVRELGTLRQVFAASPSRPGGISEESRALLVLVDEMTWLGTILVDETSSGTDPDPSLHRESLAVHRAVADVMAVASDIIVGKASRRVDTAWLHASRLQGALHDLEQQTLTILPTSRIGEEDDDRRIFRVLEGAYRAQTVGFLALQIIDHAQETVVVELRQRVHAIAESGIAALRKPLTAARTRASTHTSLQSIWLRNSIRGAVGLSAAVVVTRLVGVQQSFWVVLGTFTVLGSSAFSTGQKAVRSLVGTLAGSILAAGLVHVAGQERLLLWPLLPLGVLFTAAAPVLFSFTAGQVSFTVTLVVLFSVTRGADWQVALVRTEDVALGSAVALAAGLIFWPGGAGAALNRAFADAYAACACYVRASAEYAAQQARARQLTAAVPLVQKEAADAAARRLDDAHRTYLRESGRPTARLADTTALITGVAILRQAAESVVKLWLPTDLQVSLIHASEIGDELMARGTELSDWYEELAGALASRAPLPRPLPQSDLDDPLIGVIHRELSVGGGNTAGVSRLLWSGATLEAGKRLQQPLWAAACGGEVLEARAERSAPIWTTGSRK
ncbi:FUSC family protein [Streptomyces sp. NPDC090080]|uniref:FUSC family protein n=1 Tax=Streptomyces sp. NPDC090080 TaxID=3365939 RepID=UPI0037F657BB